MYIDTKLNFQEHLNTNVLSKVNKTIGLLCKFQAFLPHQSLVYKAFTRSHLNYGDIIYDQSCNHLFHQKMESIQYNAALTIAGAIIATARVKLYQELGLESLHKRRWYRKPCYFFKIFKGQSPEYLKYFLEPANYTTQELIITFPNSVLNLIFLKILFFHQLSLNGRG